VIQSTHEGQKIFIEHFQIDEVRLTFTFSSSPILFREFTMNPTLKFLIVLLSNLKNVKLNFGAYQVKDQHLPLQLFFSQITRFYQKEATGNA